METETRPCPECGAAVKPTATYCLACDTPIVDTERGLSVAEAVPVKVGRPVVGLLVAVAVIIALGGATYGGVQYLHGRKTSSDVEATTEARGGVALVLRAESGQTAACKHAPAFLAGPKAVVRAECLAVVGRDLGARLENVSVGTPHLAGSTGTVRLKATLVDHAGSRKLDRVFDLSKETTCGRGCSQWRLSWNGKPQI